MGIVKPAGQILLQEMRQAVDQLRGCVLPIYDANEQQEAELLGSGVLVELSGSTFLCTAKHVIDRSEASNLYVSGPEKLEQLLGVFRSTKEHDTAVLKLSPEQIALLQKFHPLRAEHIATGSEALACKYVEFIGYPETKNRKIYNKTMLENLVHSNGCKVIEINESRVRVAFDRKKNIDAHTRQRVQAPDPHGMSGGAMFGVPVDVKTLVGSPEPKLIGITTDKPDSKEVFGTNISVALAIVRDSWSTPLPERLNPAHITTHEL